MENTFGQLYGWFQFFYGQDLAYFLWGYDPASQAYTGTNIFNIVGFITLAVSLLSVFVFYYIINHPRYCKWWSWLITLAINSVISMFTAFGIVYSRFDLIPESLMYLKDDEGNIVAVLINNLNCWDFGVANIFTATIFFIVFSFIFKWWSANAKHIPF